MRIAIIGAALALASLASAQVSAIPAASGSSGGSSQWGSLYPASSAGAQVAPYSHAVTLQSGNFGTEFAHANNWSDITWVQAGNNYAIRQTGLITSISFSFGSPTTTSQYTGLYFVLCRPSVSLTGWNGTPNDCPIVAKSANLLSSVTAGAVNTLTFCSSGCASTPIYAKKGDFYGFESTGTFGTTGAIDDRFHYEAANCGSTSHCYIMSTVGTLNPQQNAWNTSWSLNTGGTNIGTDNAIPVAVNMTAAPVFVTLGDSIISGATRNGAILSTNTTGNSTSAGYDPTSQIGFYIAQATGWTYQNMGISGQNTTQIAARVSDCTAAHPQFCILEGGVNDVAQSISLATTEANWTSMLTAVKAAGITPVCLLVLPWTNGINTQNQSVDSINSWLNGQCEQYGGYTVDARPYVGQFRSGGNTDNLWNIRPEYMSVGDNLQIHYSTLGYQAIARAILDRLGITTNQTVVRKNGVYYAKSQSLAASVASTTANCMTDLPWFANTCEHGLYRLSVYMSPQTAASTSTVSFSFTYTDPGTPGNSNHSYTLTTSSLDLSSASNNLQASYVIALDGLTAPTWSTTYSGTATYQVYVSLERID